MADARQKKASRLKKKSDSQYQETHINSRVFGGRELERNQLTREQKRGERGLMTSSQARHKRKLSLKHSEKRAGENRQSEVFQENLF